MNCAPALTVFERVLVAGRGVVACRIIQTLRSLGIESIAVYSESDRYAAHVRAADRSICVGPSAVEKSYLNAAALLDAARLVEADAIHPGILGLSQNPNFARAVEDSGVCFIGPTPEQIRKLISREQREELASSVGLAGAPEHSLAHTRRIAVPLFGDGQGGVVALGDRDDSVQCGIHTRLGEAPAEGLPPRVRDALHRAAISLCQAISYRSAGTAEFLYDTDRQQFHLQGFCAGLDPLFLALEAVTGIDWLERMLLAAAGHLPKLEFAVADGRHAIQVQVAAEHPSEGESNGLLTQVVWGEAASVQSWVERGTEITPDSDRLLASMVTAHSDRAKALERMESALAQTKLGGVDTNLSALRQLLSDPVFSAGELTLESLARVEFLRARVEVLSPGTFSLVVDYPGRLGYWQVGVPPSGPMDDFAHRLANRIVGNPSHSTALELTLSGPTLRFTADAVIALTGAQMPAFIDDLGVDYLRPLSVRAGQVLRMGRAEGPGCRAYLAIRGGFEVAEYLGSRTTFSLGGFGGHAGRALRRGDRLSFGADLPACTAEAVPNSVVPKYANHWNIGVLYGPHGAPDFFTERDIETLFSTDWEVHHNSNRTGVRLLGPKPEWARADGGEAGLHPSNIHDVAYAVGTIDFTGDMPIILGPDGPSLGGFVCPATVVSAELWKLGQLRPGDRVRFLPLEPSVARDLERATQQLLDTLTPHTTTPDWLDSEPPAHATSFQRLALSPAIVERLEPTAERVEVVYRRAGDKYMLVEYGPLVLDLRLRFRVQALLTWLENAQIPGVIDLTPGIRSLQIHFDGEKLSGERLLTLLERAESALPSGDDVEVPTRIVRLPLSWDDPATRLAIAKYTQSVRPDAPWCPSNIEFIRRINGLGSEREVYEIVFGARYLVLGLGDVYLGAPVATPIDPRHRLVTTKYNPARTWTPENAVGIGGAYLCIYGMEGPGGYQFVGRTLQVYNRLRSTPQFTPEAPWLLRFFDQIQFYPVSAEELLEMREAFLHGACQVSIETGTFRLRDYQEYLRQNQTSIDAFKHRQQSAFEAERQRWIDAGQLQQSSPDRGRSSSGHRELEADSLSQPSGRRRGSPLREAP